MVDPIPNSGQAPWLYNRDGFTPFDNMDRNWLNNGYKSGV